MKPYVYLSFFLFSHTLSWGQARIITRENDKIPGKITATSGQLIHFINRFTTRPDSIPTERVREIQYEDSLRVVVVPASQRDKVSVLTPAEFGEAIDLNDYALLLQAKTVRYDLAFAPVPGKRQHLQLTAASKSRLARWITLLKRHPNYSLAISAYTDQGGSVAENQANAVRSYLMSKGISANRLTTGMPSATAPLQGAPMRNRRIEFRCSAIERVSVLYSEPYTLREQVVAMNPAPVPASKPVPATPVPVATSSPAAPVAATTRTKEYRPKELRRYSVGVYWEGLYTFQSFSGDWINPNIGPGNLQGFGGGLVYRYYFKPRIRLTAQLGYSYWAIRRRYLNENGTVAFTNDQLLSRASVQVGARLYATSSIFIQPMVGGQQLSLTSQNSESHPQGINKRITNAFLPTFGGLLGYEKQHRQFQFDIAAQYYMIPNTLFVGVTQPLHFFGIRLGIGYRPEKK